MFQTNHQEPLRTAMSPSSTKTSKPPLLKLHSAEDADEIYEICDSTPFEKAAVETAKKKRNPPPRPPPTYRHSHTHMYTVKPTKGHFIRKSSSDFEPTHEISLRDAHMLSTMRTASNSSDPLAKKKHSTFHKPKTKTK